VASLCHPRFTTTNPSYRFPIFETSATALCGTTGRSRKAQKYKSREAGKTEKQKKKEAGKAKSREAGKAEKQGKQKAEKQNSREAGKAEKQKIRETGKHRTRNPPKKTKPAAKKKQQ